MRPELGFYAGHCSSAEPGLWDGCNSAEPASNTADHSDTKCTKCSIQIMSFPGSLLGLVCQSPHSPSIATLGPWAQPSSPDWTRHTWPPWLAFPCLGLDSRTRSLACGKIVAEPADCLGFYPKSTKARLVRGLSRGLPHVSRSVHRLGISLCDTFSRSLTEPFVNCRSIEKSSYNPVMS